MVFKLLISVSNLDLTAGCAIVQLKTCLLGHCANLSSYETKITLRVALSEIIRIIIPKRIKYGIELSKDKKMLYVSYKHPLNNGDSVSN